MPGAGPEYSKVKNLLTGNRHSFYLTQAIEAERQKPGIITGKMFPTIRASDGERGGRGDLIQAIRGNESPSNRFKLWPTPTESMMTIQDMEQARYAGNSLSRPKYRDALPTPAARDYRSPNKNGNMQDQLPNVIGGSLNPDWVEWLMGWPIGWTALGPLNPQTFREWLLAFKAGWQD
ncbi:MAG: hypothetical protein ABFD97_22585 [Syntrophobacter sp.]